jgi:choline dehydrogenase-like flavoprotein
MKLHSAIRLAPRFGGAGGPSGCSAHPRLSSSSGGESLPGGQVQTDDELLDYARRNGGTSYHASCTCMMGSHAMAVVDGELKVHGLDGCGSSTPR